MRNQYRRKGFNRVFGIVCAIALLFTAIYVPFTVSAAGTVPSVEIKDNEAYVFDFSTLATGAENTAAATAENGIGYYGWGWGTKNYTEGETSNTVLQAANASGQSWGTGGGFRLHTKLADGNYGFYALEPNTRYVVSFKIRVMSSPTTVDGSKETNKSYTNLVYDVSFDPKAGGLESNYVNRPGTTAKKIYESLIDSNVFTLYDNNGNGTTYACSEDWLTATYFFTTPAEFKKDNALAFYTANYHGTKVEFDDVSVTKIGADSGIILLKDEYSAADEIFIGKDGDKIDLNSKDISDRAKNPSHTFEGWYADAGRTEKITEVAFSKTEDKTVYSRWNAPVTVTFKNTLDGTESKVTGMAGDKFAYPEDPTDPDGKVWFMGWYKDEGCTVAHLVPQFGYANETLYTYWKGEVPGLTQDFENYTKDSYKVAVDANGQSYKDNRLYFGATMTKQSEVTPDGKGYAVKYRWNPVQITDKNDYNYYDTSRVTAMDNYFWIGKGLENNTVYNVTFKYLAEKAPAPVSFYMVTGIENNAWGGGRLYDTLKNVTLELDGKWHEVTMQFTTNYNGEANNSVFLGIFNTQNVESIVYFDDVKVKSIANSAEVVMFLETGTSLGKVNHIGKRGEALNLPTITHADGAEFLGWYLDASCTTPFESDVYPVANTVLYAKWAPYAMTFREYPYGGGAGAYSDPNISVVHEKGAGNGDDHAMRFYVNRKADNTTGVGTSQAIQIAAGIEDGAVYRIKYDYKSTSIQSSAATLIVAMGYPQNIWVSSAYNWYNHTTVIIPQGGTNGWKSAEFIIRAGVKTDGSHHGNALFLRYNANIYKAGDKIDSYIDNVMVEKIDTPYVFFDGQNGGTPGFANGKAGDEIKMPATPVRVGYTFEGWYMEPECENKFALTHFEADTKLTVYAKWKQSNTYIYSFENYSYKDDTTWTFVGGERIPNAKKTGTYGVRFGNRDPEKYSMSVFMLEDGGEYYKIEKGRCYILTLNYKINKVGSTNLMVGWIASAYGNFYVGSNTGKTTLAPTMQITTDQGKEMKGKWMQQTFVLDAMKLEDAAGHVHDQLYGYFKNDQGWDIYVDDVAVTALPKGQVAVGFYAEGAKGLPKYVAGKPGQSYASKVPEVLEKENMKFKGYFNKGADGNFTEKTRGNMVFGETGETLYARFLNWERTQNFDDGFYEAAYSSGFGYTIHDFDYEVYDSEKEGNSKDNVTSGRYSLHRKGDSMFNENSIVLTLDKNIAEGERYTVSMKVKLGKHFHTDGAVKVVSSRSFKYAWTTTGDYYPVVPIAELKENEWVEVSYTFNSVESFVTIQTPGYVELFIDDIKFTLVDEKTPLSEPKEYTEYVAAERDADGKLLYKDRTAVDISSIIDESLGAESFPWIYVGIGAGALVLVAVVLVLVLVVFKKKKNA